MTATLAMSAGRAAAAGVPVKVTPVDTLGRVAHMNMTAAAEINTMRVDATKGHRPSAAPMSAAATATITAAAAMQTVTARVRRRGLRAQTAMTGPVARTAGPARTHARRARATKALATADETER